MIFLCTAGFTLSSYAVSGEGYKAKASRSVLAYLRMPASAGVAGLGGAVSALGNDVAGVMANPALAAKTPSTKANFSAERLTLDRKHYFAGLLRPSAYAPSVLGLGFVQAGVEGIERRSPNGILEGEFSDSESSFMLWYGRAFSQKISAGAAFKYHRQSLDNARASGMSADMGLLFSPRDRLSFALVGQNLGGHFKWSTGHKDQLIPSIRIGSAYQIYDNYAIVAADLEWTPGNSPQGHSGLQINIIPQFCVRAGVQGPNPIQGSGGFGIRYKKVGVDYAFIYHQSELGHSHFISLCLEMQKKEDRKK